MSSWLGEVLHPDAGEDRTVDPSLVPCITFARETYAKNLALAFSVWACMGGIVFAHDDLDVKQRI